MDYEIIQISVFKSKAAKLRVSEEDIRLIELDLMKGPARYPVIAGTGGLRKMRFSLESMNAGKNAGVRVCYFVVDEADHIYLVTLFAKNQMANLNAEDKRAASLLLKRIKESYAK